MKKFTVSSISLLLSCLFACTASLAAHADDVITSPVLQETKPVMPTRSARLGEQAYSLKYDGRKTQIVLAAARKSWVLHRIPNGFDPSLVGADSLIGFLPDGLQIYKQRKILLYISTQRTRGGGGGGECGAGAEIFLNVLSLKAPRPQIQSRHLIGSCAESVELNDSDTPRGTLGQLSVSHGRLRFDFLNYKKNGGQSDRHAVRRFAAS